MIDHRKQRFITLDGTRGIAALCVMLFHFTHNGMATDVLFPNAVAAVDYFLCLSGFVLASSYDGRLGNGMKAGEFMKRRFIRLYPMYLLGFLLGLALEILAPTLPRDWGQLSLSAGMALIFLPSLAPFGQRVGNLSVPDFAFPFNTPAWSLFFELAVNWIYAVAQPTTKALLVLVSISFVGLAQSLYFHGVAPGFTVQSLAGGVPRTLFFFFSGVLIFRFWRHFPPRLPAFWPILSCAAVAMICALPFNKYTYLAGTFTIPTLVWSAARAPETQFEKRIYSWLGEISYSIYAIHFPVVLALQALTNTRNSPYMSLGNAVALAVALAIAGFLLSRTWDTWARQVLSTWLANAAAKPAAHLGNAAKYPSSQILQPP